MSIYDCSICWNWITDSQIMTTPCNHKFHRECLSQWLRVKKSCPLCRSHIKLKIDPNKTIEIVTRTDESFWVYWFRIDGSIEIREIDRSEIDLIQNHCKEDDIEKIIWRFLENHKDIVETIIDLSENL